jgi:hypothetical protein
MSRRTEVVVSSYAAVEFSVYSLNHGQRAGRAIPAWRKR